VPSHIDQASHPQIPLSDHPNTPVGGVNIVCRLAFGTLNTARLIIAEYCGSLAERIQLCSRYSGRSTNAQSERVTVRLQGVAAHFLEGQMG
jgi:hypothetical protein